LQLGGQKTEQQRYFSSRRAGLKQAWPSPTGDNTFL